MNEQVIALQAATPTHKPADSRFLNRIVQTDMPMPEFQRMGKLPVFYYDNTTLTAIYTASTAMVRSLLPDPDMRPLEVFPGRALVAFTAFEYRDTDIDPYNEFSISFPISYGRANLPGLSVLNRLRQGCFETYVWQLPVTTEIARWGGVELYGYPKFLGDIAFTRTDTSVRCDLGEKGKAILTLEGAVLPTRSNARTLRYRTYSLKQGLPLCANIYLHPLQFAQTLRGSAARLELHEGHPISDTLARLELSATPLMYQYCPENQLALFAPRNLIDD